MFLHLPAGLPAGCGLGSELGAACLQVPLASGAVGKPPGSLNACTKRDDAQLPVLVPVPNTPS